MRPIKNIFIGLLLFSSFSLAQEGSTHGRGALNNGGSFGGGFGGMGGGFGGMGGGFGGMGGGFGGMGGGFGGMGGGMGGGFGGMGGGMGGGGGAQYKPNETVKKIEEEGRKSAEEMGKLGQEASKAIAESTQNSQKAIETVLNQPNNNKEIIDQLIENQKKQDEQRQKDLEASQTASSEQQKSLESLINSIVELKVKTLQASLPPSKPVDRMINSENNGNILNQLAPTRGSASQLGQILGFRDIEAEIKANNTTPPGASPLGGSQSHSHGFKNSASKAYNTPKNSGF